MCSAVSSNMQRFVVKAADRSLTSICPKEARDSKITLIFAEAIRGGVCEHLKRRALTQQQQPHPANILTFRFKPATSISYAQLIVQEMMTKRMPDMARTLGPTQATHEQMTKCSLQALLLATEFFTTVGNPVFDYKASERTLDLCLHNFTYTMMQYYYEKVGIVEIGTSMLGVSCCLYALSKIQEPRLLSGFSDSDEFLNQLPSTLLAWNYQPVESPQTNDLVIYLDLDNIPLHVGIYLNDNMVESKLGTMVKHVYKHGLFDLSAFSGHTVLFFRKSC